LVASTGHRLMTWEVKTGQSIPPGTPGHENTIWGLDFTPNGQLFTASYDRTLRSWDTTTGKQQLELIHNSWLSALAVSPDGSLVAGSAYEDLRIWDAKTGRERFRLFGGRMPKLQFTKDGKKLVVWDEKCYLRIWDTRNGKLLAEHYLLPEGMTKGDLDEPHSSAMWMLSHQVDISRDGSTFALYWNTVHIFDVETGKERMKFGLDEKQVSVLALSPDGKRLAVSHWGKDTETRLPDGTVLRTPAKGYQFKVWDLKTQKVLWEGISPGSRGIAIGFSPDGSRLAELGRQKDDHKNELRLCDATTGKDIGKIDLPTPNSIFSFDRTGKRLAVGNSDTTVVVYELDTALKPYAPK
jgi:WD40 repeat protein